MKTRIVAFLVLILCLSCEDKYKDCFFVNLPDNPIKNDSLSFYLDKSTDPFRYKGVKFWKMILESNKYDTLTGYWGRKGDTIVFGRIVYGSFNIFPMMILSNEIGIPLRMPDFRFYDLPYFYSSEITKVEINKNDTIYHFEHATDIALTALDLDSLEIKRIGYENLSSIDMIEKRYYVLSLKNGIIGYSIERGRARKTPLPYKLSNKIVM